MEVAFYSPSPTSPSEIVKTGSSPDSFPGISRFTESTLNQARIESLLIDSIRQNSGIEIDRGFTPTELELDPNTKEIFPITVKIQKSAVVDTTATLDIIPALTLSYSLSF
jgi:phenol 2-monooxygenase (NADPH)